MSINITVGNGQGITQAIKAHLEKQGVKLTNVKLSDWQKVMTLVNQNQQANATAGKDSIFSGGNNVSRIGQNNGDNNWKTDFQVQAGQVMQFDAGIFNKIVAVLTGKAQEAPAPQETPDTPTPPTLDTKPQGLSQEPDIPDTISLPDGAQRQITEGNIESLGGKIIQREVDGKMQDIAVVTVDGQKVRRAINEDGTLGDTLAATKTIGKNEYITGDFPAGTKILEREVNGEKQQIAVYEDENGNKQRSLVVKDPETGASKLGDNLVTISTFGKNKYITQTEMDNQMRTALGLPQDAQLPEDIKGSYVNIGGEPTLIFKKDGKTLDQAGLKEYINNLKANTPQQPQDNGGVDVSNIDKKAQELFDTINNNYGDKQGNINFEEYFNYEYQSMDPAVKERFSEADIKMVAQEAFDALDSINQDGEVTVDEIKAFLKAANTDNNQNVSDAELAEHVGGADDAEQQVLVEENVMKLAKEGYELLPLGDGSYLYQKDGKTYEINLDGSLGNEVSVPTQETPVEDLKQDTQILDQPPVYRGFEKPEQQANINSVIQAGYKVTPQGDSMVFTKDGKNYQINPNGTLGAEIKADTPVSTSPETKAAEAPEQSDNSAATDEPRKLTREEINTSITNLKPGESYTYTQTINTGMGYTQGPVTWTRNENGTLTRTEKSANFSTRRFDTLNTVYSEDRSRIISQDTHEYMFGTQTVASNLYDDAGNIKSQSIDMQGILTSKRGNYLMPSDITSTTTRNAGKYAEQTFKNTDGEVLLTYKDGQWFNEKGREISDNKAYKIMDKALEAKNLGEFVRIPVEE